MAVQLETNYLDDLRRIVQDCVDTSIWRPVIFGSRANGKAWRFSDVDLGFIGNRPLPEAAKIKLSEALDDSDIPYNVDVVDISQTTPEFQKVAKQYMVELV
ncbi:MAG: nucleotidyltransferase domain-containing protein [Candidatus Saccharimonadales bacterium]